MNSTNYQDSFIEVAEDCKVNEGVVPPYRGDKKSVANLEYELVSKNPYKYTSDDLKFAVFATRNDISASERKKEREKYFSKGQPCFRASPLTKTYGWGVHCNEKGQLAIYGMDSKEYAKYIKDKNVKNIKAMRNKKA